MHKLTIIKTKRSGEPPILADHYGFEITEDEQGVHIIYSHVKHDTFYPSYLRPELWEERARALFYKKGGMSITGRRPIEQSIWDVGVQECKDALAYFLKLKQKYESRECYFIRGSDGEVSWAWEAC